MRLETLNESLNARANGTGSRANSRAGVRARLIVAAHELFATVGFEASTTTDIAARARVSQRTFFRYFPTKEQAVLQWLDSFNEQACDRLRRRPATESELEALRRAFDHFCHLAPPDVDRVQLIRRLSAESMVLRSALLNKQSEWEARIATVLSARSGREPQSNYRAMFLAGFAMSVLTTAFREAGRTETTLTVEDLVDRGFATIRGTSG